MTGDASTSFVTRRACERLECGLLRKELNILATDIADLVVENDVLREQISQAQSDKRRVEARLELVTDETQSAVKYECKLGSNIPDLITHQCCQNSKFIEKENKILHRKIAALELALQNNTYKSLEYDRAMARNNEEKVQYLAEIRRVQDVCRQQQAECDILRSEYQTLISKSTKMNELKTGDGKAGSIMSPVEKSMSMKDGGADSKAAGAPEVAPVRSKTLDMPIQSRADTHYDETIAGSKKVLSRMEDLLQVLKLRNVVGDVHLDAEALYRMQALEELERKCTELLSETEQIVNELKGSHRSIAQTQSQVYDTGANMSGGSTEDTSLTTENKRRIDNMVEGLEQGTMDTNVQAVERYTVGNTVSNTDSARHSVKAVFEDNVLNKEIYESDCKIVNPEDKIAEAVAVALRRHCPHLFEEDAVKIMDGQERCSKNCDCLHSPTRNVSNTELMSISCEDLLSRTDSLKELELCLNELVNAEQHNDMLREQLEQHESAFQSVMDQHAVMYRHFAYLERMRSQEKLNQDKILQEQKRELLVLRERCERLENLLSRDLPRQHLPLNSSGSSDGTILVSLRNEVYRLTQRVGIYELNESRLKRRYQFMAEKAQSLMQQKVTLESDLYDVERALKHRIIYLESWKEAAEVRMERLHQSLNESVWKNSVEQLNTRYSNLLAAHEAIIKRNSEMSLEYLKLLDMPFKVSRLEFVIASLKARSAAADGDIIKPRVETEKEKFLNERILQLDTMLEKQLQQRKMLEERLSKAHDISADKNESVMHKLEAENEALMDRVSELEEMFAGLSRELYRYRESAALASAQAHHLLQKKMIHHEQADQLDYKLAEWASLEDKNHLVGRLQRELMQLATKHQQLFLTHERTVQEDNEIRMQIQRMEILLTQKSNVVNEMNMQMDLKTKSCDMAIQEVVHRDFEIRIDEWKTFRSRLNSLEENIRSDCENRQKVEAEMSFQRESKLPEQDKTNTACDRASVESEELKARIDLLESREKDLLVQLDIYSKKSIKATQHLEGEEMKCLNQNLLQQVELAHGKVLKLQEKVSELEFDNRTQKGVVAELELDLRHARTRLSELEASEDLLDKGTSTVLKAAIEGDTLANRDTDHVKLQQAAQATISGLKSLLDDKNLIISDYYESISTLRNEFELEKIHDRQKMMNLNRNLYNEKKSMIQKLKEAMEMIQCLDRNAHDHKAIQAVQERHNMVLQQWKKAEIHISDLRQSLQKYQLELDKTKAENFHVKQESEKMLNEINALCNAAKEYKTKEDNWKKEIQLLKSNGVKKDNKIKSLQTSISNLEEEYCKSMQSQANAIAKLQTNPINIGERDSARLELDLKKLRRQNQELCARIQSMKAKKDSAAAKKEMIPDEGSGQMTRFLQNENKRLSRIIRKLSASEKNSVIELQRQIDVLKAQNFALKEAARGQQQVATQLAPEIRKNTKESQTENDVGTVNRKSSGSDSQATPEISTFDNTYASAPNQIDNTDMQQHSVKRQEALVLSEVNADMEREIKNLQGILIHKQAEWKERLKNQMKLYSALNFQMRSNALPCVEMGCDHEAATLLEHNRSRKGKKEPFDIGDRVSHNDAASFEYILFEKDKELLNKDAQLMEFDLELESCRMELARVKRQISDKNISRENFVESPTQRALRRRSISNMNQRLEYENIIENLKEIIKRLQVDNRRLETQVERTQRELKRKNKSDQRSIYDKGTMS